MIKNQNEIKEPFNSVDEAVEELLKIERKDLSSEQTTQEDAVTLCKQVMDVIIRCQDLRFKNVDMKKISKILRDLGCVPYDEAAEKFAKRSSAEKKLNDVIHLKDDIRYPLATFTQLMESKKDVESPEYTKDGSNFQYTMEYMHVFAKQWLEAQSDKDLEIE